MLLGYKFCLVSCICVVWIGMIYTAKTNAKEIVATKEWTLLGENDTVAAGMHIRMDISTGQKWVKLPEEEDDSSKNSRELSIVDDDNAKTTLQVAADGSIQDEEEVLEYDFDMMHRTLSKLPQEEKERMGLPKEIHDDDPTQRVAFEARMKEIWEKRQEQLQNFSEDHLADLPQILKDRIQQIQDYLMDPFTHRGRITDDDEDDEYFVTHILSVLKDLEHQLTDIDMARDFFTLGGLPLVSSLLMDSVHTVPPPGSNQTWSSSGEGGNNNDDLDKIHLIQAYAAWTIGTAVKNIGEFAPHAVAEIFVYDSTGTNKAITPLELAWTQFVHATKSLQETTTFSSAERTKLHKTLYSLGSLLRGNQLAQSVFCHSDGPALLGTTLQEIAVLVEPTSRQLSSDRTKVARKLLALAEDMVADAATNNNMHEDDDNAVIAAFTTSNWCNSIVMLMPLPRLREASLKTMNGLLPYCSWDTKDAISTVEQLKQDWSKEEMDSDIREERLMLVESTLQALKLK